MPDHLVYGVLDLDDATNDLERRLGVRPGYGGKHAGGLTHNALLSLGEDCYLEIIAAVPGTAALGTPLAFGLDTLESSRLVTWSMKAPEIDRMIGEARARGYDPGDPVDGGRDLPDGSRLSWRVSLRPQLGGDGVVPFLTQWRSEPHPSATAPKGCRLVSLSAEHPEPETVLPMLRALGADLAVSKGTRPRLIATLDAPNGTVELC
jgi:Glyoxalase-like domain